MNTAQAKNCLEFHKFTIVIRIICKIMYTLGLYLICFMLKLYFIDFSFVPLKYIGEGKIC